MDDNRESEMHVLVHKQHLSTHCFQFQVGNKQVSIINFLETGTLFSPSQYILNDKFYTVYSTVWLKPHLISSVSCLCVETVDLTSLRVWCGETDKCNVTSLSSFERMCYPYGYCNTHCTSPSFADFKHVKLQYFVCRYIASFILSNI
jgi:hypothetical protein